MSTVLDKYVEKGVAKGKLLNKQLVLIKLLSLKFNVSDNSKEYIKQINDPAKLDNALEKVLFAKSADDVLKCLE